MEQSLFDFSVKMTDKKFFFFSVLNYPNEFFAFCAKKDLPFKGQVIQTENENQALNHLKLSGYKNPEQLLALAKQNEGKSYVFKTYDEIYIF